MDLWEALRARASCRKYRDTPVEEEKLQRVLEAANLAPSPMNRQPWEFFVVRSKEVKQKIFDSATEAKSYLFETSGWKWLGKYSVDFLLEAPVLVAVVGDPAKTGADRFIAGRGESYEHACAAAVQNMLLAATDLGLGSLWFSLFDRAALQPLIGAGPEKNLLAVICLGYSDGPVSQAPKKGLDDRVTYID